MEMYIVLLCAVIALVNAQDPLKAEFKDTSTRYVAVGAKNLKFTCTINRDLAYVVRNNIQIIRKPAVGDGEVILTQAAQRQEGEPAFYNVDVNPEDVGIVIEFEIVDVRDIDDGKLICRASPGQGETGDTAESEIDIIVVRPIKSLHLQFSDLVTIDQTTATAIDVDSGSYKVKCTVEGSNPAPDDVHVLLGGEKLTHTKPVSVIIEESSVREYRTTIEADVNLKAENSGQKLECVASGKAGQTKMVKLPIKINVYDPVIVCNETRTYTGKMYPTLTCTVDHAGLDIKGYKYEIGKTGEIVEDGHQNEDFVQVVSTPISDTITRVQLKLYEAKDWHFDSDFYVLVEHADGHITRQSVRLIKTEGNESDNKGEDEGPNNSYGILKMSLATLFMSLICFWLQHH